MCQRNPCGAGEHIIHIDWNGNIYPCDAFNSNNEYLIGHINNIKSFDGLKENPVVKKLLSRSVDSMENCSTCPWKNFCGGGCPMELISNKGSLQSSGQLCKYKKKIYELLLWELVENKKNVYKYLNKAL